MGSKAPATEPHVLASIKSSLKSGRYSDLKITCGSDSYDVHRVIVCEQAEFFARAVKFGGQESAEGKIDLPGDEAPRIKLLIQYLYEGDYEPRLQSSTSQPSRPEMVPGTAHRYRYDFPHTCTSKEMHYVCPHHECFSNIFGPPSGCQHNCQKFVCSKCSIPPITGDASQVLLHAQMYEIADKYQVSRLKPLAAEKFRRSCLHFWDKPAWVAAVRHAFSTTLAEDKGLRDTVNEVFVEHIDELIDRPGIEALLTEFHDLTFSLLKMKIKSQRKLV